MQLPEINLRQGKKLDNSIKEPKNKSKNLSGWNLHSEHH